MKKNIILSIFLVSLFGTSACKKETEKESEGDEKVETKTDIKVSPQLHEKKKVYRIVAGTADVKWTAYKTTDKVPVSGNFKTVKIEKLNSGKTLLEALDKTSFSIPVDSIFSNNEGRDKKLVASFFGKMTETNTIKGTVHTTDPKAPYVNLKMNGIIAMLPVTISHDEKIVTLKATMDMNNWKTKIAIAALNEVCNEKHKGKDGVSKTWDEVNIVVTGKLDITSTK